MMARCLAVAIAYGATASAIAVPTQGNALAPVAAVNESAALWGSWAGFSPPPPPSPPPSPPPPEESKIGYYMIQVGQWRIGLKSLQGAQSKPDGCHLVISPYKFGSAFGHASAIFRCDGTYHPGPNTDWGLWGRSLGNPRGVEVVGEWPKQQLHIGNFSIGQVNWNHLSISYRETPTSPAKTCAIFTGDGGFHPGPRDDWSAFDIADDQVNQITEEKHRGVRIGLDSMDIGYFRLGKSDATHFGIGNKYGINGKSTSMILRQDGHAFPGPRNDFNPWVNPPMCDESRWGCK